MYGVIRKSFPYFFSSTSLLFSTSLVQVEQKFSLPDWYVHQLHWYHQPCFNFCTLHSIILNLSVDVMLILSHITSSAAMTAESFFKTFVTIVYSKGRLARYVAALSWPRVTKLAFSTSGVFFTFYFRSPQLAETCDEKSEKFYLSLYYFQWAIGSSENLRVPDF